MVIESNRFEILADLQAGEAELLIIGFEGRFQGSEGGEDFVSCGGGLEGVFEIGLLLKLALPKGERGRGSLGKDGSGLGAFW